MTFNHAYERILRLMGYPPATWGGSVSQQEEVSDVMGYWTRIAWEEAPWSDRLRYAERTIVEDADGISTLPLKVSGSPTLGGVFGVFDVDPRTKYTANRLAYRPGATALYLGIAETSSGTLWVQYRDPAPQFTRVAYNGATTYAEGAVVYDSTSGECYVSADDANTGNAVTDTAWWTVQEVPAYLWEVIVRGAFSELLRNDGRGDRADVEEARAMAELDRAVLAQESQQGQEPEIRFKVT